MPIKHIMLALLVVIIWGLNFLFVKLGLNEISPFLLCAIRFLLASIPAIFFIKPPKVSFNIVASYGLVMFALQFSLVFLGMYLGMTPGMAALLMQVQVFFSILFAAVFIGDIPKKSQILGALVSFSGIALVASHLDKDVSLLGYLCMLGAAATWGFGNLITKKTKNINMMAFVVWGSFIASFPMMLLSLLVDGPTKIVATFHHITWQGISSIIYIVYASTWIGYGVWNWLLSRYPVGVIVPFTLLVPIVGIISSVIFMGEPLQHWKIAAGLLVMLGLSVNIMSSRIIQMNLKSELS